MAHLGHLLCGLMGSAQFYGVDQPRVLTCRRVTRGIRGKYDLKGLEWSPDSRGARPPGLGSAWSELGFARHVSGELEAGSRRSGGRHTLMLHLFLNSTRLQPTRRLLHPGSPATVSPEPEDKVCARNARRGSGQGCTGYSPQIRGSRRKNLLQ